MTGSTVRKFILVLLVAAGLFALYWRQRDMEGRFEELRENQANIEKMRRELEELKLRVEQARERVDAMKSDPVESEAAVRRVRHFTRGEGEKIYRVEEPAAPPPPAEASPVEAPPAPPAQ